MRLAFFDLDRTLLAVNSGTLWVRRELALGNISKRQAMRAMWWLARYQLGFASGEAMVAEAVTHITGVSSSSSIATALGNSHVAASVPPTIGSGAGAGVVNAPGIAANTRHGISGPKGMGVHGRRATGASGAACES